MSTDADGIIKIWDVRMVCERMTVDAGPSPANKAILDESSNFLVVPSDDGSIKM